MENNFWWNLAKELGIFTIAAGLITFLIQSVIKRFIDKSLQRSQLDLNRQLENHKNELNLSAQKVHKLHDRRLLSIHELYGLLIEFQARVESLTHGRFVTGMSEEEIKQMEVDEATQSYEAGLAFSNFYYKNKLYFSREVCNQIEELIKELRSCHFDLTVKFRIPNLSFNTQADYFEKARKAITEKVPTLINEIENNFRSIIGVE